MTVLARVVSIILLAVGVVFFVLRLAHLLLLVGIPDSFSTSAILIGAGAIGLALTAPRTTNM